MNLDWNLFLQLSYALGIGALIGLERSLVMSGETGDEPEPPEKKEKQEETEETEETEEAEEAEEAEAPAPEEPKKKRVEAGEFIGVRTFTALSLIGFAAALANDREPWIAPMALLGVAILIVAMYVRATQFGTGITTEIAAIGTCALGILCHYHPHAAGVIALVLTAVLASKRFTYETIGKMRRVELTDTLKFLAIILIVLPLLPNRALDPYGAFNPYKVGFLVVLISGISFVGYFLTRILGAQRGLGLTGILGGLTSSTAVTAAMAAEAKERSDLRYVCAFSTLAANATMFARVLVVVALLDRVLAMRLAWSVGTMAGGAAIASVILWFAASRSKTSTTRGEGGKVKLKNPFSVGPAVKFAVFFVMILFVAKFAKAWFGDQGLYAAAGLSGLADVDAITLSIAEQTEGGSLAHRVGAIGITIAVVSNSIVKSGIAMYSGGLKYGWLVALCLGGATAAGLVVAFIV